MKKIELVLGYECNCDCSFCASDPAILSNRMTAERAVAIMRDAMKRGATAVDFGGGEPTIRKDLPALANAARIMGFKSIGVKTNGMLFSYPDYAKAIIDAGVTRFAVSVWGATPEAHDAFSNIPGSFDRMEMGVKHLLDLGADVELVALLTNETVPRLTEIVNDFEQIGVRRFLLFLFCLFGSNDALPQLYPRITAAGAAAAQAVRGRNFKDTKIKTTHIPPCFLGYMKGVYYDIRGEAMLVTTPGHSFMAEESPFESGIKTERCLGCSMYNRCGGVRTEYIQRFSDREIKSDAAAPVKGRKRGRKS